MRITGPIVAATAVGGEVLREAVQFTVTRICSCCIPYYLHNFYYFRYVRLPQHVQEATACYYEVWDMYVMYGQRKMDHSYVCMKVYL